MSATLSPSRADAKAHQLAETFNRQAEAHEQAASEASDPFEAAAHQGAARDLRERARQALSQTEAAQRAAEAQRVGDERAALARVAAAESAAAYEQAVRAYIIAEDEAVAAVLRAADDLTERCDAVQRARADAEQGARDAGSPVPPDLIEAHVRALLDARRSPERAGLIHAARVSPAMLAPRLGVVAAQGADTRGGRR